MTIFETSMSAHVGALLAQREAQLRSTLHALQEPASGESDDPAHEVQDLKDAAQREADDSLRQVQADQAAWELELVQQARDRLAAGKYGVCQACGEPIELQRLHILPAAPLCTACQRSRDDIHGRS